MNTAIRAESSSPLPLQFEKSHLENAIIQVDASLTEIRDCLINKTEFSGNDHSSIGQIVEHWNATHTIPLEYSPYNENISLCIEKFAQDDSRKNQYVLVNLPEKHEDDESRIHSQLLSLHKGNKDNKKEEISAQVFEVSQLPRGEELSEYFEAAGKVNLRLNFHQVLTQFSTTDCVMFSLYLLKRFDKHQAELLKMHEATLERKKAYFCQDRASRKNMELFFKDPHDDLTAWAKGATARVSDAKKHLEEKYPQLKETVQFIDARPYFPAWGYAVSHSRKNIEINVRMRKKLHRDDLLSASINDKGKSVLNAYKENLVKFKNKEGFRKYNAGIDFFRSRYLGKILGFYIEALEKKYDQKITLSCDKYLNQLSPNALSKSDQQRKGTSIS